MATLTVIQTGLLKTDAEHDEVNPQSYGLGFEVTAASGIPKEIFVKQRISKFDGTVDDNFAAVCCAAQLDDLPADSPVKDSSYYRASAISLTSTNPEYLAQVAKLVVIEIQKLVDDVDLLTQNTVRQTLSITSA